MNMKMIIFNNKLGETVRIGLYDENGKWIKWVSKKLMDEYINKVDSVENKILYEVKWWRKLMLKLIELNNFIIVVQNVDDKSIAMNIIKMMGCVIYVNGFN